MKINIKPAKLGVAIKTERVNPTLEDLEVIPTIEEQKLKSENYYGYNEVTVKPVTSDIDSNIIPENIKKGTSILGVEGECKGEVEINVFMQETEPEKKDGIWLQGNYEVENIVGAKGMFSTGSWDTARPKSMPYGADDCGAVLVGTYIYLFGLGDRQRAYKYNTLNNTYTQITSVPTTFGYGGCAGIGTNIYLFGGAYNQTTAYKYDTLTDTYTQIKNIPYNFKYGKCVAIGNYIYLVGSNYSTATGKYLYRYSVSSNSYTSYATLPYQFSTAGCVAHGTDIYLFGSNNSSYYTTAYKFDTQTKLFTQLKNVPYNFRNAYAISAGTNIYLFGGTDGNTTAYRYVPTSNNYYSVTNIPYSAIGSPTVFDGTKIYLFGGLTNTTMVQALNITHNSSITNKTVVILQDLYSNQANNLIADSISGLKTYYNKVYYKNENGRIVTPIAYNGNGTEWTRI